MNVKINMVLSYHKHYIILIFLRMKMQNFHYAFIIYLNTNVFNIRFYLSLNLSIFSIEALYKKNIILNFRIFFSFRFLF